MATRGRHRLPAPPYFPTRGGGGARVLGRLKSLQNTALFSEHRQIRLSSVQESRNTVSAQKTVTLNSRKDRPAAKTHIRDGGSFHASPDPSTTPPQPTIPTRGVQSSPSTLKTADSCKERAEENKVTPIQPQECFHSTAFSMLIPIPPKVTR